MVKFIAKWHTSLKEISEENWNALLPSEEIPFYKWNWLSKLEGSQSICNITGWQPFHLSLWKEGSPIAVAPLYLKNHSYGEFIFDHTFISLSEELGLSYYPKLIGMSPISPIEGYKFFISPNENEEEITLMMMKIIEEFALKNGILSCNFLYVDKKWSSYSIKAKYQSWINSQSLWESSGEKDFSDYLGKFNANQRRNIKKERKYLQESGLIITPLQGESINTSIMENMHNFYERHCARWGEWGSKYLTKEFFIELGNSNQKNEIVIFNAHKGDVSNPIAMSLCMTNMKTLWGRYWGANQNIDFLHFEVCYYSPIEWAIEKGIEKFDPGAGGSHKSRRGFFAKPQISLHKWYDKRMESIMEVWLPKLNKLMNDKINTSNNEAPIKSSYKEL